MSTIQNFQKSAGITSRHNPVQPTGIKTYKLLRAANCSKENQYGVTEGCRCPGEGLVDLYKCCKEGVKSLYKGAKSVCNFIKNIHVK